MTEQLTSSEISASSPTTIGVLTFITLCAFAANSILARMALGGGGGGSALITPVDFTTIRLLAGIVTLLPFLIFKRRSMTKSHNNKTSPFAAFIPAVMLFSYAILFSLAYIELTTGTGALILFAAVQLTMISINLLTGNRPSTKTWMGIALAFAGLVYLLLPGVTAPPLLSAAMMAGAGMAWGIYSILGKKAHNSGVATARNFLYTLPFIGLFILTGASPFSIAPTNEGIMLAVISGSLTSGMGYLLWYKVLKHITTITAAIVQLSVPIIAAIGGVLFIGEGVSTRLIIASSLILFGIWLTITSGKKHGG